MRHPSVVAAAAALILAVLLAACGDAPTATPMPTPAPAASPEPTPTPTPDPTAPRPAPGSASAIYAPNPGAIVVGVEAGHGGCLDWGVPNPFDNTVENAEKTMTLGIARHLRDLLEAEGLTVLMVRDDDVALAGDYYPPLGCYGEPFRDVDGDGYAGFGPSVPQATRTRDELSARIDMVNVARADLLVSIHINSMVQNDVVYEIAATETFYSDRTPWAADSQLLAELVQEEVVATLDAVVTYDRQDRGAKPVDYYIIAPPPDEPGGLGPPRGLLMPGVLAEVGSMSLEAEGELLATDEGQRVAAEALAAAIEAFIAQRSLAARYDVDVPGGLAGEEPPVAPGDGPLFWVPSAPAEEPLMLTLTNTGTASWPSGLVLVAGVEASDAPYLARPPEQLEPLDVDVPALAPGESIELEITLPAPGAEGRHLAWVSLSDGDSTFTSQGSPPLQLALD